MRSSGMEEKGRWDHCLIHWFWIGLNPSCQLLLDQTKIDSVWLSPDGLRTAESWRRCRRTETSGRVCVRFEWLLLYGIACVRGLMHEKGLLYQPWLIWIALRTKILALQKGGGLHLARIFLGELAMFSMQVAGQFGEAYWDSHYGLNSPGCQSKRSFTIICPIYALLWAKFAKVPGLGGGCWSTQFWQWSVHMAVQPTPNSVFIRRSFGDPFSNASKLRIFSIKTKSSFDFKKQLWSSVDLLRVKVSKFQLQLLPGQRSDRLGPTTFLSFSFAKVC